jgi:hypothetical protein
MYFVWKQKERLDVERLPGCGQCDEVGELEACIIIAVA